MTYVDQCKKLCMNAAIDLTAGLGAGNISRSSNASVFRTNVPSTLTYPTLRDLLPEGVLLFIPEVTVIRIRTYAAFYGVGRGRASCSYKSKISSSPHTGYVLEQIAP